ncbi:MAG: N-acetyltransferase [Gemmatimonadetes bacterium]|nr:N-acetyltransferase [Gemmatimonadota bacterium]
MDVRHDEEASSFILETAHGPAVLEYSRLNDGVLDFRHTLVPEDERGHGLGARLVAGAMEHVERLEATIRPTCPFVRDWVNRHPELEHLVDA